MPWNKIELQLGGERWTILIKAIETVWQYQSTLNYYSFFRILSTNSKCINNRHQSNKIFLITKLRFHEVQERPDIFIVPVLIHWNWKIKIQTNIIISNWAIIFLKLTRFFMEMALCIHASAVILPFASVHVKFQFQVRLHSLLLTQIELSAHRLFTALSKRQISMHAVQDSIMNSTLIARAVTLPSNRPPVLHQTDVSYLIHLNKHVSSPPPSLCADL